MRDMTRKFSILRKLSAVSVFKLDGEYLIEVQGSHKKRNPIA